MFYILMFSKIVLKIFGTLFDGIEKITKSIYIFIKRKLEKLKFNRKNKEVKQEF